MVVGYMVREKDACEIIRLAADANIRVYLDGGWGVDALIGRETRIHQDIDLFAEGKDYNKFIDVIRNQGYSEIEMAYTTANHTVWRDSDGRVIDLHRFEHLQDGNICYDGECFPRHVFSGNGQIGGIPVLCIEPESQVLFHLGYEYDAKDLHDVKLLCEVFDIPVPDEYEGKL